MKKSKPRRKAPDWRCPGVVVLRDVPPGCVPLRINVRGVRIIETDFPADLVEMIEQVAKANRRTFGFTFCRVVEVGADLLERKQRGFS